MLIMKILPVIIPCCLLFSCEPPQDEARTRPATPIIELEVTKEVTKTPSLLDSPEAKTEEVDHQSKFTFLPPKDNSVVLFGNYVSTRPESWLWVIPKTLVVTCNYSLPSFSSSDPALITIMQFKNEDSESIDKSIERWKRLFRFDGGGPITVKRDTITVAGKPATQITMQGEYMGAGAALRLENHMLFVTIFKDETTTTYIKVLGHRKTIHLQKNSIDGFLADAKWVEQQVED